MEFSKHSPFLTHVSGMRPHPNSGLIMNSAPPHQQPQQLQHQPQGIVSQQAPTWPHIQTTTPVQNHPQCVNYNSFPVQPQRFENPYISQYPLPSAPPIPRPPMYPVPHHLQMNRPHLFNDKPQGMVSGMVGSVMKPPPPPPPKSHPPSVPFSPQLKMPPSHAFQPSTVHCNSINIEPQSYSGMASLSIPQQHQDTRHLPTHTLPSFTAWPSQSKHIGSDQGTESSCELIHSTVEEDKAGTSTIPKSLKRKKKKKRRKNKAADSLTTESTFPAPMNQYPNHHVPSRETSSYHPRCDYLHGPSHQYFNSQDSLTDGCTETMKETNAAIETAKSALDKLSEKWSGKGSAEIVTTKRNLDVDNNCQGARKKLKSDILSSSLEKNSISLLDRSNTSEDEVSEGEIIENEDDQPSVLVHPVNADAIVETLEASNSNSFDVENNSSSMSTSSSQSDIRSVESGHVVNAVLEHPRSQLQFSKSGNVSSQPESELRLEPTSLCHDTNKPMGNEVEDDILPSSDSFDKHPAAATVSVQETGSSCIDLKPETVQNRLDHEMKSVDSHATDASSKSAPFSTSSAGSSSSCVQNELAEKRRRVILSMKRAILEKAQAKLLEAKKIERETRSKLANNDELESKEVANIKQPSPDASETTKNVSRIFKSTSKSTSSIIKENESLPDVTASSETLVINSISESGPPEKVRIMDLSFLDFQMSSKSLSKVQKETPQEKLERLKKLYALKSKKQKLKMELGAGTTSDNSASSSDLTKNSTSRKDISNDNGSTEGCNEARPFDEDQVGAFCQKGVAKRTETASSVSAASNTEASVHGSNIDSVVNEEILNKLEEPINESEQKNNLRKRRRELKNEIDITKTKNLVSEYSKMLSNYKSMLQENCDMLRLCSDQIATEEELIQESKMKLEEQEKRKVIMEGMLLRATKKLLDSRSKLSRIKQHSLPLISSARRRSHAADFF